MSNRTVRLLSGVQYFSDTLSIFVNRNTESYELTEHHHDFLEFSYVSEGTGTHHTGAVSHAVSPGDLFAIPMGVSHVFRPSSAASRSPLIVYNCIVTFEAAHTLLANLPGGDELQSLLTMSEIVQTKDRSGEVHRLFTMLYREYSVERPGREAALYGGLLQLLVYFSRLQQEMEAADGRTAVSRMDDALGWLERNFASSISVEELSSLLGIGTRQLQRLFVKHTGMSVTHYIQRLRIEAACRLLLETDHPIHDIAESVGYSHTPFFNRLFKSQIGVSPREYRRSRPCCIEGGAQAPLQPKR
jgi:AraC family L-rhamnose operon transcriptional activator RhaR